MPLPVFEIADDLRSAVSAGNRSRVLLKAPTGSGKSTEVPGMLVDAGISGMILVIEPRRMAARTRREYPSAVATNGANYAPRRIRLSPVASATARPRHRNCHP
jgi:predicted ABC-type ATPase